MYRLTTQQRAQILNMQIEGVSIRVTCRLTGRSKGAVTKLIVEAGQACAEAHGNLVRDLRCEQVQVDELWAFVGMKQKRVPAERKGEFGIGDVWTFTSIDPETKLIPTWLIGRRDASTARQFLVDMGRRIRGHFQLTSDGASFYREAAEAAFGGQIDYAQLVKLYSGSADGEPQLQPARVRGRGSDPYYGRPGRIPYQHITRRAPEPQYPNVHAALHPPDQRLLQEGLQPELRDRHVRVPPQLRAAAHDAHEARWRATHDPGDGRWPS